MTMSKLALRAVGLYSAAMVAIGVASGLWAVGAAVSGGHAPTAVSLLALSIQGIVAPALAVALIYVLLVAPAGLCVALSGRPELGARILLLIRT